MTNYKPCEAVRIHEYLQAKKCDGAGWWEIMGDLHIGQYNRAIKQLREGDYFVAKGVKGPQVDVISTKGKGDKYAKFYLAQYAPKPETVSEVIKSKVIFDASTFQMVLL